MSNFHLHFFSGLEGRLIFSWAFERGAFLFMGRGEKDPSHISQTV